MLIECLEIRREANDQLGEADTLHLLGFTALGRSDPAGALPRFEQALSVCRVAGLDPIPEVLWGLALSRHKAGEGTPSTDLFGEALACYRQRGDAWGIAMVGLMQAAIAQDRGDEARAAALAGEALTAFWEIGDERDAAGCLVRLACAAAVLGHAEPAARLLGAAERWRADMGVALHPDLDAPLERALAAIRADLGDGKASGVAADGKDLSLGDAVAEAVALAERLPSVTRPVATANPNPGGLTPRELDVLRLVAAGHADREIAAALFVSRRTVTNHVASILAKLEVRSRAAAAAHAVRQGLG